MSKLEQLKKARMMLGLASFKAGDVAHATGIIYDAVDNIKQDLIATIPKGDQGIQGVKGDKGDRGEQGKEGKPGLTVEGPEGEMGPRGIPGPEGKIGFGMPGQAGKDGSPDTAKEIAEKLNTLPASIDASVIKNLPTIIETRSLPNISLFGGGGKGGGNSGVQSIVAGQNITVTKTDSGKVTISAPDSVLTDEKVKFDTNDPTAGFVADKVVAGTGISVAEGAGANENKLVITNSNPTAFNPALWTMTYGGDLVLKP